MNTLICPVCDYTLHGDSPEIVQVCEVCKLAHKVANLNVQDLWRFMDTLQKKEKEGNYTYSYMIERGDV